MSDPLSELQMLLEKAEAAVPIPEVLPPLPKPTIDFSSEGAAVPPPPVLATAEFGSVDALYHGPPGRHTFFIAASKTKGFIHGTRDDRHVLVCGGSRAGKGVSLFIPNASQHMGSMVALDIKGELANTTARVRANGSIYTRGHWQRTFICDPMRIAGRDDDRLDDLRARFNPLDFIDPDDPESIDDCIQLADSLCPEDTNGKTDPFFQESARTLIQCVIMHVLTSDEIAEEDRTIITVQELLAGGDHDKAEFWRELDPENPPSAYGLLFDAMRSNKAFDGKLALAGERFGMIYNDAPKQFMGVLEIANRRLELLQSPGMREFFSASDFDLADLKGDPKGISIYLCLPPRMLETHGGFFRMMITMIIREMEKDIRPPASGAPVLMLLDEFAALKRMRVVENAIAQLAGYGVRMVMAVQSLPQLKEIYKDNWENFMGSVGLKLFLGNEDHFTRDYVSKLVGETEVSVRNRNRSRSSGHSDAQGHTVTTSEGGSFVRTDTTGRGSGQGNSFGMAFSNYNWSKNRSENSSISLAEGTNSGRSTGRTTTTTTSENVSEGEQINQQTRPLIRPDEVGRMGARIDDEDAAGFPGTVLALVSGHNPIKLRRSLYYRAPMFEGWFDPHPAYPYPPTLAKRLDAEIAGLEFNLADAEQALVQERATLMEQMRQAVSNARKEAKEAAKREHDKWLARLESKRLQDRKDLLMGLFFLGPVILTALTMGLAFTGYMGGRLLTADTFTADAAWRAVKAFPLMEPAIWGPHLAVTLITLIKIVLGTVGLIIGWRIARKLIPFAWEKFNGWK